MRLQSDGNTTLILACYTRCYQVHMLDMECFTFLNRALESPMSPYVVLASNRGYCTIRGTEADAGGEGIISPHGLPMDLLDRCMIVKTHPYKQDEIRHVLEVRCKVEGLTVAPEALDILAAEGIKSSLRCVSCHKCYNEVPKLTLPPFGQIRPSTSYTCIHRGQAVRSHADRAAGRRRDECAFPRC